MDSIQKIQANIFVLRKSLEYKYEYCSVLKNNPNTKMNTIQFEKNHPNTNTNTSIRPQLFE